MRLFRKIRLLLFTIVLFLLLTYFWDWIDLAFGKRIFHQVFKSPDNIVFIERVDPSALPSDPAKRVLLIFSRDPYPCYYQYGETILEESFRNKLQFGQLKGYDVMFNKRKLDPDIPATYNKVALLIEIIRNETFLPKTSPMRHEWLFWVDSDALFSDMSFDLPLDKYKYHELVLVGYPHFIFNESDSIYGLNSGVMLLKNSKWSLEFLELVLTFGRDHGRARVDELKATIKNYKWYINEQNALIYIFNKYPEYQPKVYFETNSEFAFNGHWLDYYRNPNWNPFIVHFAGCKFCFFYTQLNCRFVWKVFVNQSSFNYRRSLPSLG